MNSYVEMTITAFGTSSSINNFKFHVQLIHQSRDCKINNQISLMHTSMIETLFDGFRKHLKHSQCLLDASLDEKV